ncbi:MAG: hypothetical protein NC543_01980 [bacterium]|nr:hypothetical protein [bacterium]MCM1374131.1 hypothetical protein [Muribaculum sp.]
MKKKMAILGLAGALLCSGISVFAASDQCGHPAVTLYYGEEYTYEKCQMHDKCTVRKNYLVEYATCHSCFVSFPTRKTGPMEEMHIPD